jgi:FkbH-like protein
MNATNPSMQTNSVVDYINTYKKLKNRVIDDQARSIKIAIISSFTLRGFKETLFVKCYQFGIVAQIFLGSYSQYMRDILDENSDFYAFAADLVIIFLDSRSFLGEHYLSPYSISDEQRRAFVGGRIEGLVSLVRKVQAKSDAKILLHNFEVPLHSPLGILENKQDFGIKEAVETANSSLRDIFRDDRQVYIFDYDAFCSKIGKRRIIDYKLYYLGHFVVNLQFVPELCQQYLGFIKPMMSLTRKCIVLDLDNTLWGGIIGEDGLEGLKLGPSQEGQSFYEFQKYLLALYNRGIILAINSKNNYDDALSVFREHPFMLLKEQHFASMQINWSDKVSNMQAIARELNIGLDSLVYIDDDKFNREIVRSSLPEVLVIDLPSDPSYYLQTLMELDDFNLLQITDEDKKKGLMYAQQRKRSELQLQATDISHYLQSLEMVVIIERANQFNTPRISQLTQKTNQFNLTTRRYLEEDIKGFAGSDEFVILSLQVQDKFGDNGITGAAIIKKQSSEWVIDTFLLSCRIIGRRIEEVLLSHILDEAKKGQAQKVIGEFIPTQKNTPSRTFFKDNGFILKKSTDHKETWEYDLSQDYHRPDFIKVIVK